jgi:hypothetical protein
VEDPPTTYLEAALGRNSRHFGGYSFGYDFLNPGVNESGWRDIRIRNPDIDFSTQSDSSGAPNQGVAISIEGHDPHSSNPNVDSCIVIEDPTCSFGQNGIQIRGGWQNILIIGGTYQAHYKSGILLGWQVETSTRTLSDVTILNPVCRWNNQSAGTTNCSGLQIGTDSSGSGSPTVTNVRVLGGSYYDDKGNPNGQTLALWRAGAFGGTPTQVHPISICCGLASATTSNVFVEVDPDQMHGNTFTGTLAQLIEVVFQESAVGTATNWNDYTPYSVEKDGTTLAYSNVATFQVQTGGLYLLNGWITAATGASGTFKLQVANALLRGGSSPVTLPVTSVTAPPPGTSVGAAQFLYIAPAASLVLQTIIVGAGGTYSYHFTLRLLGP